MAHKEDTNVYARNGLKRDDNSFFIFAMIQKET